MKPWRALTFSLLILLVTSLPGCTRKEEKAEAPGGGLIESDLAKRLPAGSTGFALWDFGTEAAKQYKQSTWGTTGHSNILQALKQIESTPQAAYVKPFIDAVTKTGLLTTEPGQPEVVRSGLAYLQVSETASSIPALGFLLVGYPGQDLKPKLAELETVFKNEGYGPVKREGSPGGFSIPIRMAGEQSPPIGNIHFVATDSMLAVATQENQLAGLLAPNPQGSTQAITETEQYKATLALLPGADQLSVGYLDVKSTIAKFGKSMPVESMPNIDQMVNAVPIESVAWSHRYREGVRDSIVARIVPRDEQQKLWLGALTGGSSHETLSKVPADVIAAVSLDGGSLARLKNTALAQGVSPELELMNPQLAALDSLRDLTLAIRGASSTSPFPELLLVASSTDAAKAFESLKTMIDQTLMSFGLQLGDWQEKEVNGTSVKFLMSPLGIGAFAAQSGDAVILGTSEMAVLDAVGSAKDESKSLRAHSSKSGPGLIGSSGALVYVYSNFERMSDLVQSVQGNLAMFTGGQGAMPDETIQQLKKLGVFTAAVSYKDNLMRLESRYESTAKG